MVLYPFSPSGRAADFRHADSARPRAPPAPSSRLEGASSCTVAGFRRPRLRLPVVEKSLHKVLTTAAAASSSNASGRHIQAPRPQDGLAAAIQLLQLTPPTTRSSSSCSSPRRPRRPGRFLERALPDSGDVLREITAPFEIDTAHTRLPADRRSRHRTGSRCAPASWPSLALSGVHDVTPSASARLTGATSAQGSSAGQAVDAGDFQTSSPTVAR